MITCTIENIKCLDQKMYDTKIDHLEFHTLTCSCGHSGCLIKHGYYTRFIKTHMGKQQIRVLRVKCSNCGKTHAILFISIVPYSQVLYWDCLRIITNHPQNKSFEDIMMDNVDIDESTIQYVIKQYLRHWKERLLSYSIPFINCMFKDCFRYFGRQFMQIKCTPNILYYPTHIA